MDKEMVQVGRRWLRRNATSRHEFFKLELSGAWELPGSSGPSSHSEAEETQLSFLNGN